MEKLTYRVKHTGSLGIDIYKEGNIHPIFFTASNHPQSQADAARIVELWNSDLQAENEALKERLKLLEANNDRLKKEQHQNGLLCVEFGYKQCEKGENIDAAFMNFNKLCN